ncbi:MULTISPECIES: hypothetical protein [unclassified Mesorhizobium]|uniref:NAD(P)/FAD-dependent oxidoreductase n=1 Tax=unclassified Mesorhizobium TaxID=325217 RepID=UPI00333BC6AA
MKRSLGLQRHATIAACHLLNLKSSSVRLADPGQRYLEVGILSRQLAETITFGGDHIRTGVGNDAPARSVLLLEAGRHDRPKPGEVLPAVANGLLRQLGVWTPFAEAGFVENRALVSVWANEVPSERHGMFSAQGAGWQLDRTRFDRLMVQAAKAAGVDTRFGSAVGSAVRDDQGWLLKLADEAIVARAVVWATGRSWRLARCFGAKLTMHGHLAAYTRFFDRAPGDCSMVVEARPEGWWYSADLRVPHRSGSGQRTAQSRTLVPSFSRNAVHRAARAAQRNRDRQHDQGGGNRNRSRRR